MKVVKNYKGVDVLQLGDPRRKKLKRPQRQKIRTLLKKIASSSSEPEDDSESDEDSEDNDIKINAKMKSFISMNRKAMAK